MKANTESRVNPHYLITRDGFLHKGRPAAQVGAHCQGDSATSIGICCVGAGDALPVGTGYLTPEMGSKLLAIVHTRVEAHHVPVHRVVGRRERPSGKQQRKTCQGPGAARLRNVLRHQER